MATVLNMSRLPGREVPAGAVYIGGAVYRAGYRLLKSKWANPFREGRDGSRAEVIEKYRAMICERPDLMAALPELCGRDLVCWCAPLPCHGDVLLLAAAGPEVAPDASGAPMVSNRAVNP